MCKYFAGGKRIFRDLRDTFVAQVQSVKIDVKMLKYEDIHVLGFLWSQMKRLTVSSLIEQRKDYTCKPNV